MPKPHKEFAIYKLNEVGMKKAEELRDHFDTLLEKLETICPDSREFSIVKTKLEEAAFFAKKSIAVSPLNHQ